MALGSLATFALMKVAGKQRGYCTPSGDYAESNNMTILYQMTDWAWAVKGQDGKQYAFEVCPTATMRWKPGQFIEVAHYEYRNGCADFTGSQAYFRLRR